MPTAEIYRIYLLRPGARPRRYRPLSVDEVNTHRCIECANYNDCLLFVARTPWEGFSCDRCPAFVRERHG